MHPQHARAVQLALLQVEMAAQQAAHEVSCAHCLLSFPVHLMHPWSYQPPQLLCGKCARAAQQTLPL